MGDIHYYQRPWFYLIFPPILIAILYFFTAPQDLDYEAHLKGIIKDVVIYFGLLILWLAFFSQFILPVQTFRDRQKIFSRLIIYLLGQHGPALFIENGSIKDHSGERLKKGPGVLWLDSASAAVTRTPVTIKQTIGPGVHFIDKGEYVAGTVDLHVQSQTIGPKESDKPFEEQKEGQTDDEWRQVQARRKQVSALTRDGIEVVPNISVTFRINTGFPKEGQSGSRFGYRTGHTRRDKENEKKDKDAISKAILRESINPNVQRESPRRRVAWNQLPALVAVDVWREYVSKFTLNQLFESDQLVLPTLPEVPQPTDEEIDPLRQPIQVSATRDSIQDGFAKMLREINLLMSKSIRALEEKKDDKVKKSLPQTFSVELHEKKELPKKTSLQLINDMVKARLTEAEIPFIDEYGVRESDNIISQEFMLMQGRGLIVQSVNITNLRFSESIEKQLVNQWKASWYKNAKAEEERINRQIGFAEIKGQEEAEEKYASALSRHIMKQKPMSIKETIQALLMRTRLYIIRDDQLQRRMNTEREEIEHILQSMENGQ
jgi:hypothetical protein